jgi:two-component system, NarL family, response regulator NreC
MCYYVFMAKTGNIKALIIDNHPLFIMGLSSLLEKTSKFNIIGTTANYDDALKIAENEKPKLILMEIRLGKENGLDLIPKFKSINSDSCILIVSMLDERFYSERILKLGARGYVLKTESADTIMDAINTVMDNKVYLSENERNRIFQAMAGNTGKGSRGDWTTSMQMLSNRELQVFSLIAKGFGTIEIASLLNLSNKTIDTHKEHIKLKLHCNTAQELRQQAIEWSNHSGNL